MNNNGEGLTPLEARQGEGVAASVVPDGGAVDDGVESKARELCREEGLKRMDNFGPTYVPCLPYRTWSEYEDANWRRFLGTARRRMYHGGEQNPRAKLTREQVNEIRASTLTDTELGEKYGVGRTTIRHVLCGETWP